MKNMLGRTLEMIHEAMEMGNPYQNTDLAGRSLAAAARSISVVDGREAFPVSCGGGARCATAAMSQEGEKEEDGCEEDEERCPSPYLWARGACGFHFYSVRLP